MTTDNPDPPYMLRIRNADCEGGLSATLNQGEMDNSLDVFKVRGFMNTQTYDYFCDFQQDGVINVLDYNFVRGHLGHNCSTPNNP